MIDGTTIQRIKQVLPILNEAQRRIYLAAEAEALGHGGITQISKATGVSRVTITAGMKDLKENRNTAAPSAGHMHIRREGGGRKPIEITQPGIREALESLMETSTFGDPQGPLLWTTKSLRNLEGELQKKGYQVKYRKIGYLLKSMGYSLQVNQKMNQVGDQHPDRDAQFQHINRLAQSYIEGGYPVISVDCKKKENIGNFKNTGAEYSRKKQPTQVLDHDFPLPELGKAAPYGVYDIGANEGFVSVGISADTAQFAVNTVRSWWNEMGREKYPATNKLLITADGGGSNGSRNRRWKIELQKFADEAQLDITVCHFPPGTSKWNKIEHRLFSQITKNWRGRPLETLEVIVNLIASTKTEKGLIVKCKADTTEYQKGVKVTDEELAGVNLFQDEFHPNWNYTIRARKCIG